ncbi:transcriptional regulator [Actinomycetospora sp. NBRC 106375]|uniref:IclR family transcriptional regulator n=1 Tax=Actinomycetospora sp. NBRC 106375 TaxID=3032207 RepID=UPI00249F9659|nr:IclR family transcriptional regulator [Actinomycetospora sp. NBRC 106375]GLZ49871.1 transcriptional regulator [Actinomycetospora sp. NBRC 106375]
MQVVRVTLAVLRQVAVDQPVGVSALARALELPKSTTQRHLKLLAEEGWLVESGADHAKWELGPASQELARRAPAELNLRDAALPAMHRLAAAQRETVYMAVPSGEAAVLIERVDSPQPVRTYNALGTQVPLHGPATGKAILAHLPGPMRENVLNSPLTRFNPRTLHAEDLARQLDEVRTNGFAVNVCEWRPDVVGFASPVLDGDGAPLCSIGLSMPASRYAPERLHEWGAATIVAATEIRTSLGLRTPLL